MHMVNADSECTCWFYSVSAFSEFIFWNAYRACTVSLSNAYFKVIIIYLIFFYIIGSICGKPTFLFYHGKCNIFSRWLIFCLRQRFCQFFLSLIVVGLTLFRPGGGGAYLPYTMEMCLWPFSIKFLLGLQVVTTTLV